MYLHTTGKAGPRPRDAGETSLVPPGKAMGT